MKIVKIDNAFLLFWVNFLFSSVHINHGISTAITNNGQRILYSNEIYLIDKVKINSNIGFHNETSLSVNYYNQLENNSIGGENYIPISVGFHKELFKSSLVGNFKPYIFTEIGNVFSIKQINFNGMYLIDFD